MAAAPTPTGEGVGGRDVVLQPDDECVARLRDGDEAAFATLVAAWSPAMLRVAEAAGAGSAAPLVQEAWLLLIGRVGPHDGAQAVRVQLFGMLVDLLRRRTGVQVRVDDASGPVLEPARFRGPDDQWPGGWTSDGVPAPWPPPAADPDAVAAALGRLPAGPRLVVTLRDVCGFGGGEVRAILGLSDVDQRALLHRGRSSIRAELEQRYRHTVEVAPP